MLNDVRLPRADQTIAGVVTDPNGKPLANVHLWIWGDEQNMMNRENIRTDSEGRFRLTGLVKGRVQIQFNHDDYDFQSLSTDTSANDVKVVMFLRLKFAPASVLVGQPAPDITVKRWEGASARSLKDLHGKVVLLAFLSNTKPSVRMGERLKALQDKYAARGLVVLPLCERATAPPPLPLPVACVPPGVVPDGYSAAFMAYGVRATPTLFLIDKRGVLRYADVDEDLEKKIEEMLKP
ncbi:MAG: carboxypeptidase regulatory-like domain-containing protein [Abditibacteriales bacterium]|nr:carboxypeptidase regulatory-like domain-containing protein [Abditibacteriales bacterium]MDW8367846.1 carboxypeptidase regulatory-like domain-containing protein [Abditibacteriales bacterium]